MKVNQIATILNETFNSVIGESALIATDLSNLISVGHKITASTEYWKNINGYLKTIFDKVGVTLYNDVKYKGNAFPVFATDAEYGSMLEKIRIIPSQYEDNKAWTFTDGDSSTFDDMFGYHPAKVSAKYFNSISTYRTEPITLTEKQLTSGFRDRGEMLRFMGMVENAYMSKMAFAYEMLTQKLVAGLISEKIHNNNNGVINLLTEYNTATGSKLTAAKALTDTNFLKFAGATYKMYVDFLTRPTMLYNVDGYVNYTSREDLVHIMLTDFSRALETYLYSDTFNPQYLQLGDNFVITPYWQGNGTSNTYSDRSSINAIAPSDDTKTEITQSGIVAVVFDRRAVMVNARRPETAAQLNAFDDWYNYIWKSQAGFFVDAGENALVFIIADETPTTKKAQ